MRIEYFSDLVCPWCFIGKRRLDLALRNLAEPTEITWRTFQLDPTYPDDVEWTLSQAHQRRYGIDASEDARRRAGVTAIAREAGLEFHLEDAIMANTFDAHRLLRHASAQGRGTEVAEDLMRAYAMEGRWIGSTETLREIAQANGVAALPEGVYADEIKKDRALAARYGVSAVPTLIIDGARTLVSPTDAELADALDSLAR